MLAPQQLDAKVTTPVASHDGLARGVALFGSALLAIFVWAYWPTITYLVDAWNNQPDYSHGFLVPFLSLFFLWLARDSMPGIDGRVTWIGLTVVLLAVTLRWFAGTLLLTQVDAWTIPLWIAGVVWVFCGPKVLLWSLPAILFLYFMVPLPYRMETWLSLPLQTVATKLSVWSLQCLGQPAIAEAHTIHMGSHQLEVEQACSGLRMLVGVLALAVAYIVIFPRSWWERAILIANVVPVALIANTARIVVTGLLFQYVSSDAGKRFSHDFAGWAMILLAVGLFGGVLWYIQRLLPEHERVQLQDIIHTNRASLSVNPPKSNEIRD